MGLIVQEGYCTVRRREEELNKLIEGAHSISRSSNLFCVSNSIGVDNLKDHGFNIKRTVQYTRKMRFINTATYISYALSACVSYGALSSLFIVFKGVSNNHFFSYIQEDFGTTIVKTTNAVTTSGGRVQTKNVEKTTPIDPTTITTKNVSDPEVFLSSKYLLYGSTSGWANQLLSLEHAYWIAFVTNRTLILPPVLYHFDATRRTYKNIVIPNNKDENSKNNNTMDDDAVSVYYDHILKDAQTNPKKNRLPMTSILDFQSWNNIVPVIDYSTFVHRTNELKVRILKNNKKGADTTLTPTTTTTTTTTLTDDSNNCWEKKEFSSDEYNCHFFKYTMNASKHDIEETATTCLDHIGFHRSKHQPHTYKYQHIETSLAKFQDYNLWSFQFIYPSSLFDVDSMPTGLDEGAFQVHYTPPIRNAWRKFVESWDKGGNRGKYASIHIRGYDGPFKKENWTMVIPNMLETTHQNTLDYLSNSRHHYNAAGNNNDHHDTNHNDKYNLTLVVVSDLPLWNKEKAGPIYPIWKTEIRKFSKMFQKQYSNINFKVVTGGNDVYDNITKTLGTTLGGSYEVGVYFDQLLAACADISFVGSNVNTSSFQTRIQSMRTQASSPCL